MGPHRNRHRVKYLVVTDHALVRWLERVCGFPMEQYRAQLFETLRPIAATGATAYRTAEATYCFRDGILVTVLEPGMSTSGVSRESAEALRQHAISERCRA